LTPQLYNSSHYYKVVVPDISDSIQKNTFFNWLAADWAFMHAIATHLTSSVSTQEDHVLQTIHTNWAACLQHIRTNYNDTPSCLSCMGNDIREALVASSHTMRQNDWKIQDWMQHKINEDLLWSNWNCVLYYVTY